MAIGSKITITTQNKAGQIFKQYFETTLVNGFSAQHDPRVHLGLGSNDVINNLNISWCGTISRDYQNLKIDNYNAVILD